MGGGIGKLVSAVVGFATGGFGSALLQFAVSMVASAVISKIFAPDTPKFGNAPEQPNPGNRQQLPPAGDNKLPVAYGRSFLGGIITDVSITSNNQTIYWVLSICEVTNSENKLAGGPDSITFGTVYWGGKRVVFNGTGYEVTSLVDVSTGQVQQVDGRMHIYLYTNGSNAPFNSTKSAIEVMQDANLIYKWDSSKAMTNCAFAIVRMTYSNTRALTGLSATKFEMFNSRSNPADCFLDYMTSERYGAAISLNNIDTTSLDNLRTYSNAMINYTTFNGLLNVQTRYRFDGAVDTSQKIMANLQAMADSCNVLLRYNEIMGKWGVIVQRPDTTPVLAINDSNIVSAITISPIDISNSFNVIEVKFPLGDQQDSFASAIYDLAQIDPSLLYPNEPVNKQSVNLYFVNNSVRAQYIANILLKSAREDLQVTLEINYIGLQLDAGDIVTVSNTNYGWVDKPFRINKVVQKFGDDGSVTAQLNLAEYNSDVYSDVNVKEFDPIDNSGLGDPLGFGAVPAPIVQNVGQNAPIPFFNVVATTPNGGFVQYAEIWYSAFAAPTDSQRLFAGTTAVQSNGNLYDINTVLPAVQLANIPAGNWYFFSRMVNNLGSSNYSAPSTLFVWRPTTFQFNQRYAIIAYADTSTGGGFSLNPRNKSFFGIHNDDNQTIPTDPTIYDWYAADPAFGTNIYLTYANRQSRRFSFDTGFAALAAGSAAFVPTQTTIFDPTLWSALPDGTNIIDLDARTGQLISTGTTTVGTGEIGIGNSPDGRLVAQLQQFLNFGAGVYTYTGSASTITIDIYGRVVGFETPDNFYMTIDSFTATAGQTVFTPSARATGSAGFITGQDLVFYKGLLLPLSDYTENATTVTLDFACAAGDVVTIISYRSVNTSTGNSYPSFTRNDVTITNVGSYDPPFTLTSGFELLFLNGCVLPDQDYDIIGENITNFPSVATGLLSVIQWTPNNLSVPNGTPVNITINATVGQATYNFSYTTGALNIFSNGVLFLLGTDYTTSTNSYTLDTAPSTNLNVLTQQTYARAGAA